MVSIKKKKFNFSSLPKSCKVDFGENRRCLIVVLGCSVPLVRDTVLSAKIYSIKLLCLPSLNVLGALAASATVGITDLEDGTDGATVFSGRTLHADIVLSAVVRVSVSAERSHGSQQFAGSRTVESVCYFCGRVGKKRGKKTSLINLLLH